MSIGAVSAAVVGVGALFSTSTIFMVSSNKIEIVVGEDLLVWESVSDILWVIVRSPGNGILVVGGAGVIDLT